MGIFCRRIRDTRLVIYFGIQQTLNFELLLLKFGGILSKVIGWRTDVHWLLLALVKRLWLS